MMNLDYFKDVHPNWHIIENLDEEQAGVTLDLLLMAAFINDELTPDETEVLTEEWRHLPFVGEPESPEQLQARMKDRHSHFKEIAENPKMFAGFIEDIADAIDDDDVRFAIFRLLAITTAADGFDEAEIDLCYAVGSVFGLERGTIDDTLRSIWESHEKAVDTEAGVEHHIPHVVGSGEARKRTLSPYPNPFHSRVS